MHTGSQFKLLNAGFILINAFRDTRTGKLKIEQKTKENFNWHTLKNDLPTKAALKREMNELLKQPNIIDLNDSLHSIDSL